MKERREEEMVSATGRPAVEIEPWNWPADAPIQPVGRDGEMYLFRRVDYDGYWAMCPADWALTAGLGDMLEGLRSWVRAHFSRTRAAGDDGAIDQQRLVYVLRAACEVAEYRRRHEAGGGRRD